MFDIPLTVETLKTVATLVILTATVYSFVREKIPADLSALLALCALVITGVLVPEEAFSGFSHPATVSVAAVLVLSAAIERTGLLGVLARRFLAPLGQWEFLFTLVMMLVIAVISAFINNTAAVAIFIPVVMEVCRRTGASPGRILMPMAHAATIGGMCTLMGTSTNLVAHEFAVAQGLSGFSMFELGQIGLPMAAVGFGYMLLVGRWFLPRNPTDGPSPLAQDDRYFAELTVPPDSAWIGREVKPGAFAKSYDIELLGLMRGGRWIDLEEPGSVYAAGDLLNVRGGLKRILSLTDGGDADFRRTRSYYTTLKVREDAVETPRLAEVVVLTPSGLIGQTLQAARFAERHDTVVLALKRRSGLSGLLSTTPLHAGDVLLVEGEEVALAELARAPGFLAIGTPARPEKRGSQLAVTLLTLAGVIATVTFGLAPIVTAAVAGSALLMLTGCLKPREAYEAVDLSMVFMLAGSLALGLALEKTGITEYMAQVLAGLSSPTIVLAGFFLVSVIVSELMSNSGTVALLGPVAVSTATQLDVNPMALLTAVTFGASAAFAMPIGYQTSLMIYGPGGYRFTDFVRMGIVLDIILAVLALWLIPYYWPLALP